MKKIISCIAFVLLLAFLLVQTTEVLTLKPANRYYILKKYLEENPEKNSYDVKVFGSCHAYTSFNPVYLKESTGVDSFVYANAGEIIPTTYARMVEQFKKHTPKVALVEIWGINPYETYDTVERIFGDFLVANLESIEFSLAKLEVINDFKNKKYKDISFVSMNFPFVNYKDRVIDDSLTDIDFNYNFEDLKTYSSSHMYDEMVSRLKNNGFKANPCKNTEDYPKMQNTVNQDEMLEIEADIAKYIQKIIDLCAKKGVELIFYRSPYVSSCNELKKRNYFAQLCEQNGVKFIDLEEEINYDYTTDFYDYQHLSEIGANKSTELLMSHIMEALGVAEN